MSSASRSRSGSPAFRLTSDCGLMEYPTQPRNISSARSMSKMFSICARTWRRIAQRERKQRHCGQKAWRNAKVPPPHLKGPRPIRVVIQYIYLSVLLATLQLFLVFWQTVSARMQHVWDESCFQSYLFKEYFYVRTLRAKEERRLRGESGGEFLQAASRGAPSHAVMVPVGSCQRMQPLGSFEGPKIPSKTTQPKELRRRTRQYRDELPEQGVRLGWKGVWLLL